MFLAWLLSGSHRHPQSTRQPHVSRGKRVYGSRRCARAHTGVHRTRTERSGTAAHRDAPDPSLPAARGHTPSPAPATKLTLIITKPLKLPALNPHGTGPRTASRSVHCRCSASRVRTGQAWPRSSTSSHLATRAGHPRKDTAGHSPPASFHTKNIKHLCRRCSRNTTWS